MLYFRLSHVFPCHRQRLSCVDACASPEWNGRRTPQWHAVVPLNRQKTLTTRRKPPPRPQPPPSRRPPGIAGDIFFGRRGSPPTTAQPPTNTSIVRPTRPCPPSFSPSPLLPTPSSYRVGGLFHSLTADGPVCPDHERIVERVDRGPLCPPPPCPFLPTGPNPTNPVQPPPLSQQRYSMSAGL